MRLISYLDGTVDVIEGPCAIAALRPRFLHLKLREQLAEESALWPVTEDLAAAIVAKYQHFIVALAEYLRPAPDLQNLSALETYYWFIATEPEPVGDELMLGLSHIETLMGITRKSISGEKKTCDEDDVEISEDAIEGTGDPLLDLVVDAHLIFKRAAPSLLKQYGVLDLYTMMAYASRRHEQSMARAKQSASQDSSAKSSSAATKVASVEGRDVQISPAVAAKLDRLGVELPSP